MTTVALEHVSKSYDGVTLAVDHVDLEIANGEFFVLLGPSGCGKSTVLRMVAGLESVTSGVVRIDAERVNEVKPSDRDIAMVFQSGALYPHMTVAQNIGFPLRMTGEPRRSASHRVAEIAEILELGDLLQRLPNELSGGQRQRVAMGKAIIRSPRLFLMDEPMSNLDAALRSELRADISRLQRRLGTTTIYVTHDQVEAMTMGDQVALMRDGRVVQSGRPLDVYHAPRDLFVATFLGSPSMGLVKARVVDHGGHVALRVGSVVLSLPEPARRRFAALGQMAGRDVVLGIRPEDLRVDERGQLVGSAIRVERLGHEQLVWVALEADCVVPTEYGIELDREHHALPLLVDAERRVDIWQPLHLDVDLAKIHLFDLDTGVALGGAAA